MREFLRSYSFLLAAAAMLCALVIALAVITPFSPLSAEVAGVVMPVALVMWVMFDARHRRATPCYDFGFLLLLCWYVSVPWYVLHTRGLRGLLIVLLLIGLYIVPSFVFFVAFVATAMAQVFRQ